MPKFVKLVEWDPADDVWGPDIEEDTPPLEGWHKPCTFDDHQWELEIENGHVHISCKNPCDPKLFDPKGPMGTCQAPWESDDYSTFDPIPVRLELVDESTPSGPWGPAEYDFWIKVLPNG